jgi:predicted secreted protein
MSDFDKLRFERELMPNPNYQPQASWRERAEVAEERARQAEALVHQLGEALAEALGVDGLNIMFTDGALATRAEWSEELEALAAFRAFGGGR